MKNRKVKSKLRLSGLLLAGLLVFSTLTSCTGQNPVGSDGESMTEAGGKETSSGKTEGESESEGTADPYAGTFRVGYGRVNITPEEDVPMGGYGNSALRISDSVLSYLYASCIAVTGENDETVLFMTMDVIGSNESVCNSAAKMIENATGVPADHISFSATHTHCCADLNMTTDPRIMRYSVALAINLRDAAVKAMEDRVPATLSKTTTETEGLNFVRHYKLDGGLYGGDNHNSSLLTPEHILGHASEADHVMQLVKITREGADDILLTNFQTHPHRAGGSNTYHITADLVGAYRDKMEAETGMKIAYFSGAGGNLNPSSRINSENVTANYKEQGEKLADYALAALPSLEPIGTGAVKVTAREIELDINHSEDDKVPQATQVYSIWTSTHNINSTLAVAEPFGIYSPFHANAIKTKAGLDATGIVPIRAYSFGDFAVVFAPYEMFDSNGVVLKESSPFKVTFIATCANAALGYIPSAEGYTYGCYESDTGRYVKGSGEVLINEYLKMLDELNK